MRLNGCDNVTVVGNAVGPDYPVHIRDRSNSAVQASIRKSLTVDCVSIDRYCKDNSIIPDIIKIDVEGFEIDVLEGAREILKSRPALFIEVHSEVLDRYGRTIDDIWSFIDRAAYRMWIYRRGEKIPVRLESKPRLTSRFHLYLQPMGLAS